MPDMSQKAPILSDFENISMTLMVLQANLDDIDLTRGELLELIVRLETQQDTIAHMQRQAEQRLCLAFLGDPRGIIL